MTIFRLLWLIIYNRAAPPWRANYKYSSRLEIMKTFNVQGLDKDRFKID